MIFNQVFKCYCVTWFLVLGPFWSFRPSQYLILLSKQVVCLFGQRLLVQVFLSLPREDIGWLTQAQLDPPPLPVLPIRSVSPTMCSFQCCVLSNYPPLQVLSEGLEARNGTSLHIYLFISSFVICLSIYLPGIC